MSIKILHTADFHLDSPFDSLPEDKAAMRRSEQRVLLERTANIINSEGIELVLLSGDLFDSDSSYSETKTALEQFFAGVSVPVFISPGNHDYYSRRSPYCYINLPDNVHVFTTPSITCVELPELGCRVWGAGYNARNCPALLSGFTAPESSLINIMALHGNLGGDTYCPVTEKDIAESGLDYLALGHVHSFSGIRKAGGTFYAYPGCPEGRGFDETGDKGIIAGTVSKGSCSFAFLPLGGRKYAELSVDLTDCSDALTAAAAAVPEGAENDIYKITLCGSFDGSVNCGDIASHLADRFFHVRVENKTCPRRSVFDLMADDSLKGLFLTRMRSLYDAAPEHSKESVLLAAKYGLAAMENGEEISL